ncbi:membrane protein [Anaeromicropila populeti]|uniref:Membrane protein n=2 Tax=Anaeromicropila populeti TaxID=37658 RepID=A0A1I6HRI3_9FIRM|nr:membrane protein [Anaeromicropila populeti]
MKILSLYRKLLAFMHKLRDDYVSSFSAQAAFFIIISAFPFAMFLLTLIQYLPFTESTLLSLVAEYIPPAINATVISIITEIYDKASGTIISITAITALWSASRGFLAVIRGLNSVYGIHETRNYFKLRLVSTFYTLNFAIMLILSMCFLVFGNSLFLWIQHRLPKLEELALVIISLRTIVIMLVLVTFFLALYLFVPDRKSKLLNELPGAILSAAGWLIFSYLYSYYIEHLSNFSYTYGSLTAIVLLMLWLYACMYILFIGGAVNVWLKVLTDKD